MILRHTIRIIILSVLLSKSFLVMAANFTDGVYEIVVTQGMKGMPGGMGSYRWRECLASDKPMPTKYLQAQSCDVLELKTLYRTVHYKLSCFNPNGSFINEGKLRFSGTQINGKSKSNMGAVDGESMVMRYKFRGRRIGNCQ